MAEYPHQPHLDSIENNLIALIDSTSALRRGFTTIASSLAETQLLLQEILNLLPPLTNQEQSHDEPEGLLDSTEIHTIGAIVEAKVFDEMLTTTSDETWMFGDHDETAFIDNEDKAIESQETLLNELRGGNLISVKSHFSIVGHYRNPIGSKSFEMRGIHGGDYTAQFNGGGSSENQLALKNVYCDDSIGEYTPRATLIGFDPGGSYFAVPVYVGTPPQKFYLLVDTASTVTFVPLSGCAQCGKHQDPMFKPGLSSTFRNVSCTPSCNCDAEGKLCVYKRNSVEQSSNNGILAEDVFSFGNGSELAPQQAVFGCEDRETGDLHSQRADGIMGLGDGPLSIVDQLVDEGVINNSFSLCFGGMDSGGGEMVLGRISPPHDMVFSHYNPLRSRYYNIDLKGIRVAGKPLKLNPEIFDGGNGTVIVKSCAGLSSLKTGKQIHCVALVSGFDSDSFVMSSLVHMYVQCNRLWEARNVFDRLPQPDVVTCSALLSGHARNGHVKEAKELLNRIKHLGLGLNSVTWNGMIVGFNHSRHYLDVVVVFRDMHLEGFVLDEAGISSVLPGVGDLEMLDMGIQIHCYVMKKGFEQDKCVVSALIDMYGKCGSTMEMLKVFDEMDEKDIGSCNALVTGLARNGCVTNALELFDKFQRQRMDLNVVSWTSIIASCSQNGKDIVALELFKEMQVEGVKPNSRTIPSLLPACGNIAALMHGKAAHCFSLKRGISYDVHWMFLLLLFTNYVDHVEQQVTPLILVASEASYILQPMSILVKLMLQHATFMMKQWLILWDWCYSLAFNLADKVVLKGGVML